ncbi:TPA: CCA tRNA nucleotidyltransferase [Candidatus Berkelbacteria bacterium]|uniref:tRNA nucleotidyltransferase/poly(A) polymerase, poly(A) polymerase n=1 Tax=Berkelbacteria bacterium GW2011_GWE1_39_12 TaxID=1618337 RepID=A0A0G4B5V2_9BACT|nr:MAG: tRNA nucleotidyltransferase/poly(A) polymerase, poly(A) polymerase [Berkelbacteria bacterium GW2011_GWE1_39_12]HBO60988.1 CCA tRNA nucleotidyltransferase [Candidatus Berkelbacteria bacterium]
MINDRIKFTVDHRLDLLEEKAIEVVKVLQKNNFECYFAGGAVRDLLLNRKICDIDIATSAKQDEVKKLFPITEDRGKSFGVIVVKMGKFEFEVATFRKDIGTTDHRRPKETEFTSAEEDAKRRDFTINGLFYDPVKEEIIDYVEGIKDIKNKVIRFIGNPTERINEDYLRLLRAIRFAGRLDFQIEENTFEAIKKNADKIKLISVERIRDELSKILQNENRSLSLEILSRTKLLKELFPELEALKNVPHPPEFHSEGDVWTHNLLALNNINDLPKESVTEELVWAVLLHDIAKPETIGFRATQGKTKITFFDHDVRSAEKAKSILERMRFSHSFINAVVWAISQHMRIVHAFTGMSERKQKKLFLDENIQLLLDLTYADLSASLRPNGKPDMQLHNDALEMAERFSREMKDEEKNQMKKFDLVTGKDIMEILKIPASKEVGKIKSEIEKAYFEGKINTREEALKMVNK